jgi:predicted RNase H-like HicB family nuclease
VRKPTVAKKLSRKSGDERLDFGLSLASEGRYRGGTTLRTFVIVIEQAGKNYSAHSPEVPGCVATGTTEKETESNMRQALEMHLEGMEEDGLPVESREVVVRRVRVGSP